MKLITGILLCILGIVVLKFIVIRNKEKIETKYVELDLDRNIKARKAKMTDDLER
ncbi:hypothetical protein [Sporohalobacter salinus]|uniref:hypothetical protein n=1 Tax=Sporohalobacter salinus TaxID=1494606 RepID=UPI001960DF43|nr:hypothetical protein [Sporohalobacter salinus]MBM7623736.1 hypothetical protein [Sporohalobacter salinus]